MHNGMKFNTDSSPFSHRQP